MRELQLTVVQSMRTARELQRLCFGIELLIELLRDLALNAFQTFGSYRGGL